MKVFEWLTTSIGRMAYVKLDRDTNDFDFLIGKVVDLDGVFYVVRGVERFLHIPPWRKGEGIGLLVERYL